MPILELWQHGCITNHGTRLHDVTQGEGGLLHGYPSVLVGDGQLLSPYFSIANQLPMERY
ncbi:MAG: hypothetical protein HY785_22100 [Oscillatoriophycideae cyanobacterium NC_groundwater_1537_Pr4_S-0.65um_50_18]|nr:hypothetical protein [Oscillatoriophycideae cyanobacterium NC_groundwater_1537_Pr4_S-0.65um_50_18]